MKDYVDYFRSGMQIAKELRSIGQEHAAEFIENLIMRKQAFERERDHLALNEQGYAVRSYEVQNDFVVWKYLGSRYKAPPMEELLQMIKQGKAIEKNEYVCIDIDILRENGEMLN